jgi:(E)-4-hydroxy-3-methylbut-2-enyl-diphosphate synthase
MSYRSSTRSVAIGGLHLGGDERILVQSMANIKTSKVNLVSAQINRCAALGADLMRVSVLDEADALAIKEIKKQVKIPLVADIHIDYRLALLALESGVDAVRINPGNIGSLDRVKAVVEAAKTHHAPIRVGVNGGSLDKTIYDGLGPIKGEYLVESAAKHVKILEDLGFHDIVISLKGSSVQETLEAYRLAAQKFPYPLHLGITEAGPKDIGLIRSAAGLSPLLLEGIGNTIRISLSDAPEEEIKAGNRLLHDLGFKPDYPTFISCPTCGRTQVDLIPLANRVLAYLEENHINKTVAIMGCIVNGPGEAKHADIGVAGGKGAFVIFKKGQVYKTVEEKDVYDVLISEINKL